MVRFGKLFPEIALRETRMISIYDPLPPQDPRYLPKDDYSFDELYCTERGCDCHRVVLVVYSRHAMGPVATINHAFAKPAKDAIIRRQTFLDPLHPQSQWSRSLLETFESMVRADNDYRQRLMRHYRMFRDVVNDPSHPAHHLLDS